MASAGLATIAHTYLAWNRGDFVKDSRFLLRKVNIMGAIATLERP